MPKMPELHDQELIDDRALERASDDRFRHGDFADELAALVRKVATPANIALFAPWGTGKTGLSNLLKGALEGQKGVRFARFDAMKYAEAPLRRHFLSQVAKEVGISDQQFSDDLYRDIEDRKVRLPGRDFANLLGAFLLAVAALFGVLVLVATFVASISEGSFGRAWSNTVKDYLLATVPVAAVITVFVRLAAGGLTVKTTRSAPSGEEEFERVFRKLVKRVDANRLVIFIDELDRCSPDQVVSTLETMKTFLEVEGCVFVVAADHQVLEQALRKRVRQETPEDPTNPYYSAGSSYLDKVFQYQLALPPLKPIRLSNFALELVKERPGLWQRVSDLDEVVSVVVPTHVTSPRRVKVLLNSFALAYRLAERRAADGFLAGMSDRASELAVLVCLRCEFPLFAADLTIDPRLPQFVRILADREELPAGVRMEVRDRASAYLEGRLPVAELLVADGRARRDGRGEDSETPHDAKPQDDDALEPEEVGTTGGEADSRREAVRAEHTQQLVRYLRKTAHISGPGADLIYLESAGAGVDLDASAADQLERAAVDGDLGAVLDIVVPLPLEQRQAALLVLSAVVAQAPVGVEGENAVSVLLKTITRTDTSLEGIADRVADAVAGHQARVRLREEDLVGALELSLASTRALGQRLQEQVLAHPAATTREDVALKLISGAHAIPGDHTDVLGRASTLALLQRSDEAGAALLALDDGAAIRVLRAAEDQDLGQRIGAHYDQVEEPAPPPEEGQTQAAPSESPPHEALEAILDACLQADRGRLAAEVARVMLDQDRKELRDPVEARIDALSPIGEPDLVRAVLESVRPRATSRWPRWIGSLDSNAVIQLEGAPKLIDKLSGTLWQRAVKADNPDAPAQTDAALGAVKTLVEAGLAPEWSSVSSEIETALAEPFTYDDLASTQAGTLSRADRFRDAGVLNDEDLAREALHSCIRTLQGGLHPSLPHGSVPAEVHRRVVSYLKYGSETTIGELQTAVTDCGWIPDHLRLELVLRCAAELRTRQPETPSPLSSEQIRELAEQHGHAFDAAAAVWVEHFADSPAAVWLVLAPWAQAPLPAATEAALRGYSSGLSQAARVELLRPAIENALTVPVDASFLAAGRLREIEGQRIAPLLLDLGGQASNLDHWRTILRLWSELAPTGDQTRRRLVDEIYLPLVKRGGGALDLALEHFGLVSSPPAGRKKRIRDALRDGARGDQQRRVDQRLQQAGWLRRSLFGLGPLQATDDEDN